MATPRPSESLKTPENAAAKVTEAEKVLLSIRQARDAAIARSQELAAKLVKAEERIAELGDQCSAAHRECQEAERNVKATKSEREELRRKCEDLRHQVRDLNNERVTLHETEKRLGTELDETRQKLAAAGEERDRFRKELGARRGDGDGSEDLARQLKDAKSKIAQLEEERERNKASKKNSGQGEQDAAAKRTRDLAVANVIKVQAQVNTLKNELAAQRKQFKEDRMILEAQIFALRLQAGEEVDSAGPQAEAEVRAEALAAKPAPAAKASQPPLKVLPPPAKPFTGGQAAAAVAELTADLERLTKQPSNPGLLERLDADLAEFSERARESGLAALQHESMACLEMTRWLRKTPAKVHLALGVMAEAITVLAELAAPPPGARDVADPTGAIIYAVDDDVDNCECIAMALEKFEFQTRYAGTAERALTQLKKTPVDMIVLDVDLPKMDGFELHDKLRKVAHHAETPIIFLSGLISTKERLEELPPGNHAFMSKPYNLTILGAKAMTMILRQRLAIAGIAGLGG